MVYGLDAIAYPYTRFSFFKYFFRKCQAENVGALFVGDLTLGRLVIARARLLSLLDSFQCTFANGLGAEKSGSLGSAILGHHLLAFEESNKGQFVEDIDILLNQKEKNLGKFTAGNRDHFNSVFDSPDGDRSEQLSSLR